MRIQLAALRPVAWAVLLAAAAPGANAQTTLGRISGRVTDAATGAVLPGVPVRIYDAGGGYVTYASTDVAGNYRTPAALPAGSYYAVTDDLWQYLDELYDDIPCAYGSCPLTSGTPITVVAGATTSGIDFALEAGGRISGRVTDAATGGPLRAILINVYNAQGSYVAYAHSDVSGDYTTSFGLAPGNYYAVTDARSDYLDERYDDLPCVSGACPITGGTPIAVVAAATTSGIDFALQAGGRISGRVTDAVTGAPLQNVRVGIYDSRGYSVTSMSSDVSGEYVTAIGLPTGSYYARTEDSWFYLDELFDDQACAWEACAVTSGAPISVTAGTTATGIDFTLQPGGRISGRVTAAATGAPLHDVSVRVYDAQGQAVASTRTDIVGEYTTDRGLPTGSYYVRTEDSSYYLDELFDDIACAWEECTVTSGTPIAVTAGTTHDGIDLALRAGGRISGTVTDEATGAPLRDVTVSIFDSDGYSVAYTSTDVAGRYSIDRGLPPGSYYAGADAHDSERVPELYDDIPCPSWCTVTSGTPIAVAAAATTSGIDFALEAGGRIAGRVTDATTGAPLSSVSVEIYDAQGGYEASVSSDVTGAYATDYVLREGTYFVRTNDDSQYLDELHDGVPCVRGSCTITSGTPVAVVSAAITSGIDFALLAGGRISGRVTDEGTGAPLRGVSVDIYNSQGSYVADATTDSSGRYTTARGLPTGSYYARSADNSGHYLDELYDDVPCASGVCTVTNGTPIAVTAGATTSGIDFALRAGGRISGKVTDAASGAPLPDAVIRIYDAQGLYVTETSTGAAGDYTTEDGLPAGTYFARTLAGSAYLDELYDDVPCLGWTCAVTSGTPIAVTVSTTTSGIDFALAAGGRISGKVTDAATGAPLRDILVAVYDAVGSFVTSAFTDVAGDYRNGEGLPPGTYFARTADNWHYLDELFDGIPCAWSSCTATSGTPIAVMASATTSGVDFALRAGGRIRGKVTDAATGAPLRGTHVEIYDAGGQFVDSVSTDVAGDYLTGRGLPPGNYHVRTADSRFHLDELYDDVPCARRSCAITSGTPIAVAAAATTEGIDLALEAGGQISGRVIDALTAARIDDARVTIYDAAGQSVEEVGTGDGGEYSSSGMLPAGTYYARAQITPWYGSSLYADQLFSAIPCEIGCTVTSGTPIVVTSGVATAGIDFDLAPARELTRGADQIQTLAARPAGADVDRYVVAQERASSYEVVVDGVSGDVQTLDLVLLSDGVTPGKTSVAVGAGACRSLRWETSSWSYSDLAVVRIRSGGCAADCGADDVYRIRLYETTCSIPRFNNSDSQFTLVVLQNTGHEPVEGTVHFWAGSGGLLESRSFFVAPKGVFTLNTAAVSALAGQSGSITIAHDAPYGALAGKATAIEPATGRSYDSPLEWRIVR